MGKIQRAVISLSDRADHPFAKEVQAFGVEILSTGGTAKTLRENGLKIMMSPSTPDFQRCWTAG